jgi:hypothetical protein
MLYSRCQAPLGAVLELPVFSRWCTGGSKYLWLLHWNSHWLVALVLEVSDSRGCVLYVGTRLLWLLSCKYEAPGLLLYSSIFLLSFTINNT